MITSLTLRNFRAYRHQHLEFSNLNIFIGPNNSGKSSILSAINLLAQTIDNRSGPSSPLLLNGPFEELGTFLDVVHGNNPRTVFGMDFRINHYDISFDVKYRTQRREMELIRFSLHNDGKNIYSYSSRNDTADIRLRNQSYESVLPHSASRRPIFRGFLPVDRNISFAYLRPEGVPPERIDFLRGIDRELRRADSAVRDTFARFDTLSPFRDQPKRTYLYTGENPVNIGRTGANGINMLVNDVGKRGSVKVGIEDELSKWFRINGISEGLKVKSLTPRHFEVCVIDFKGKEHNICDVGFGCSQVLPVLVGGLNLFLRSRPNSSRQPVFVVQEPEIHLHPNAQASLGSFFVGLTNFGGQIFIETHSDNLVVRIARHVAAGELAAESVRLFFVEDKSGEKIVTPIGFDEKGRFEPEWPGGFMPQRQSETLQLARARSLPKGESPPRQLDFFYRD